MKPAPFAYYAPTTLDEALSLLSEHGYDAKVLAGGQSLVPMMNFRIAQPAVLVDINNIPDLAYINAEEGGVRVGALTRHHQSETSPVMARHAPLIYSTMPKIAYPQVRTRGTFGGSLSHADPSAELPTLTTTLDAKFRLVSQCGERWVSAREFFLGLYTTALEPDEILIEGFVPELPPRSGWSLQEVNRRKHDFALAGVAAVLTLDESGICQDARLVFLSVGDHPMYAERASNLLKGQALTPEAIRAATELATTEEIDPGDDIHATADFRRHLAKTLCQRAIEQAHQRAQGKQ
ncbi:MAG: xanthine dehydrogenase family protein subunit M [Anaerolineales bacterium]|nr:xanthine dehydrogenase family protein subunit M [Anaerolineales bacterium]MCL4260498.1 xanthine dehydrogenase family protein subunit M [Anaerolineales bacterium]